MTILDTPVPLQEWFNRQRERTPDTMIYKRASAQQIMFVRDEIGALFNVGLPYESRRPTEVIATHTSKSVELPVYSMARADLGLRLVMRENFYDWKCSVLCERELDVDFAGLCYTTPPLDPGYTGDHLSPTYFEGFPRELVFGDYGLSDRKRFSAEFYTDYALWTAIFLILRAAGTIRPFQ